MTTTEAAETTTIWSAVIDGHIVIAVLFIFFMLIVFAIGAAKYLYDNYKYRIEVDDLHGSYERGEVDAVSAVESFNKLKEKRNS